MNNKVVGQSVEDKNYKFIKRFFEITISELCKELKLSRSYFMAGKYSPAVYDVARDVLEIKIAKLFIEDDK